jgi:hypothetical protein
METATEGRPSFLKKSSKKLLSISASVLPDGLSPDFEVL